MSAELSGASLAVLGALALGVAFGVIVGAAVALAFAWDRWRGPARAGRLRDLPAVEPREVAFWALQVPPEPE